MSIFRCCYSARSPGNVSETSVECRCLANILGPSIWEGDPYMLYGMSQTALWKMNFFLSSSTVWDLSKNLVEHNTFIPSELQSCKSQTALWKMDFFWVCSVISPLFVCLYVQHNTLTPIELQSCKFKYTFLTRVPRKVFELFSKFCFFGL